MHSLSQSRNRLLQKFMKSTCNALSGLALSSRVVKIFSLGEERLLGGLFVCLFMDKDLLKAGKHPSSV